MPKRKRVKEVFEHSNKNKLNNPRATTSLSNVDQNNTPSIVYELDLRGHSKTPDELKLYLREKQQCAISDSRKKGKLNIPTTLCAIRTDLFPRGCMQVLLDYVAEKRMRIQRFQNDYGKVYKYHLQNPDLKALVASQGKWLTHLRVTPSSSLMDDDAEETPRRPKLQGCGYRRTALYAINLQVLEISLHYDVKRQLLDLTRRNPLRVENLHEIILWDVGTNTNREQLATLVRNTKSLRRPFLHDIKLENEEEINNRCEDSPCSLQLFLIRIARDAGNVTLKVDIVERKN